MRRQEEARVGGEERRALGRVEEKDEGEDAAHDGLVLRVTRVGGSALDGFLMVDTLGARWDDDGSDEDAAVEEAAQRRVVGERGAVRGSLAGDRLETQPQPQRVVAGKLIEENVAKTHISGEVYAGTDGDDALLHLLLDLCEAGTQCRLAQQQRHTPAVGRLLPVVLQLTQREALPLACAE